MPRFIRKTPRNEEKKAPVDDFEGLDIDETRKVGEMFSLRDASSASSSGVDEDSFGWWIGVESHAPDTSESKFQNVQPPSPISSDCASSATSTDECQLQARNLSQNDDTIDQTMTVSDEEQIELCSLDGAEAALDSGFGGSHFEGRTAVCYTPERLVKSEDFRIVPPSPRFYPTLSDLMYPRSTSFRSYRSLTGDSWLSDKKVGTDHLAALLRSPYYESSSSSRSSCRRCCCIRYGDGEVLLHTKRCPRNDEERLEPESLQTFSNTSMIECTSFCAESLNKMDMNKDEQLADDTSGVSSVSCSATEEDEVDRLPNRLSEELAYVSFQYAFATRESQTHRISGVNDVVSILAGLDSDPQRVEELLLEEDRFGEATQSGHDSLTRLALAIEPDAIPIIPTIKVNSHDDRHGRLRRKSCHAEIELELLRNKIERLQGSSKDLYQEITSLRRDFTIDEWKVNHLSEDINKLRTEVYELRYLDDLLKLLKGELERISNRNWPFAIGRTKNGTEEINLVV